MAPTRNRNSQIANHAPNQGGHAPNQGSHAPNQGSHALNQGTAGSKAQLRKLSHGGVWLNSNISPVTHQGREPKGKPVTPVDQVQRQPGATNRLARFMTATAWRRMPYPTKRAATAMVLGLPAAMFGLIVWLVSLLAKGI